MRQEEFNVACKEYLGELAGQANVQLLQNNDLVIMKDSHIGMVFHLGRLHDTFEVGDFDLEDFLKRSFKEYDSELPEGIKVLAGRLNDYEYARKFLSVRVLPYKPTGSIAEQFLDLWVVVQLDLGMLEKEEYYSTVVTEALANVWGFQENKYATLIQEAIMNMKSCLTIPLENILQQFDFNCNEFDCKVNLFVITSESKMYGAGYLACLSELRMAARVVNGSYYVIPSSIHELLIIPAKDLDEEYSLDEIISDLKNMIKDVNSTCVSETEKLSDHPYFYDAKKNQVISLE